MEIQLLGQPLRGGADVGKNNSGETKPDDGKDGSNSGETKPDGGEDDSNSGETKPDDSEDDSNPGETKPDDGEDDSNPSETRLNIDQQMILVPGRTYSILKTEVTQELYESVMDKNPSGFKEEKNLPVEQVSWYDAVEFCNRLSKQAGLEPAYSIDRSFVEWNRNANGYRLPTVEEWQYAAKGGQEFVYSGSGKLDEVGWYKDNSEGKTHPVAQKAHNGYGLYDMSGNVGEWCWGSDIRFIRYFCGGNWCYGADDCEVGSEYGHGISADDTRSNVGFRIVRSTGK